jgi:hypothetical protein
MLSPVCVGPFVDRFIIERQPYLAIDRRRG